MGDFGSKLKCTQNENVFEVEEIFTNILLRLPIKSLLICKSVCKYWRGLISSPSFMQSHLLQSQENPSYVFYPFAYWDNIDLLTKTDGKITQNLPGCDEFYFKGMICSFNGLICCINFRGGISCQWIKNSTMDIRICNPATREVLLLPPTPTSEYLPKVGVSFGPTINEYKVFQFFYREEQLHECMVYSSITRSWKSIGGSVAHIPFASSNHVCINGMVYWFSKSRIDGRLVGHILAIDMEENFSVIRIPEEETLRPFLVNLEGCLCLVAENGLDQKRFDIWALEDSKESVWVKKWSDDIPHTFNIPGISYVSVQKNEILFGNLTRISYVSVQKNEILFGNLTSYALYNMGTRTCRNLNWDWIREYHHEEWFFLPMAYTESLLPCNGRIDS